MATTAKKEGEGFSLLSWRPWRRNAEANVTTATANTPTAPITVNANITYDAPDPSTGRAQRLVEIGSENDITNGYRRLAEKFVAFLNRAIEASPLQQLREAIEAGMRSKAAIEATYKAAHQAAVNELNDAVTPFLQKIADEVANVTGKRDDTANLAAKKRQELADRQFQLTGEPNHTVDEAKWLLFSSFTLLILVVTLGIETGLTSGIIAFYSDLQTAQIMGLAISMVITVFAAIWGATEKIIGSARDTKRRHDAFMARRGGNTADNHYRALSIWQPESLIYQIYNGSKTAYILTSLGWFGVRLVAVFNNPTADNGVGLLVAGMVSLVGYAGKMLISIFFPPYGFEHNRLSEIRDEIAEAEEAMVNLENSMPEMPAEVRKAADKFKASANKAWDDNVTASINNIRQAVANALFVGDKLNGLRGMIRTQFGVESAELFGTIKGREATDKGHTGPLNLTFRKSDALQHLELPAEDTFIASLRSGSVNPESLAPVRIAAEPNRLIGDLVKGVTTTVHGRTNGVTVNVQVEE